MFEILKNNTFLGIALTIILGAIGSGLWDIAIKPICKVFSRYILKFCTLGLAKLRNPIYKKISRGKVCISRNIYSLIATIVIMSPVILTLLLLTPIKSDSIKLNNTIIKDIERVTRFNVPGEFKEMNGVFAEIMGITTLLKHQKTEYSDINNNLEKFNKILTSYDKISKSQNFSKPDKHDLITIQKNIASSVSKLNIHWNYFFFRAIIISFITSFYLVVCLIIPFVKDTYINDAVSYFTEILIICKPFINENEYDVIRSNFAQIKTKENYLDIISNLQKIAEKNNLTVRDFAIF
ncbi:MAG: hypothetical protein OCC45_06380 [Desulfotalea sp.]